MRKVGTIEHRKSGLSVNYYLDGTLFVCTCLEKKFSAPDAKMLQEKVEDYIEHWMTLDWFPIIEVELKNNEGWGMSREKDTGVLLSFKRFFVSKSPAGKILTVDWDVDVEHRKASCGEEGGGSGSTLRLTQFPLQAPLKFGYKTWLNFDESVWANLQSFKSGLEFIYTKLAELITTKAGNKKLLAGQDSGVKLLT